MKPEQPAAGPAEDAAEKAELELVDDIASFSHDPEGFADFAFPWGEPGSVLEKEQLEDWQRELLRDVGQKLRAGTLKNAQEALIYAGEVIRKAIASGHGIGKSALVSILILWAISTFEDTRGIVTAETDTQLKTKTWPEVGKWYQLFIARHWFIYTATAIYSSDPKHERTWRIDAIPWSEARSEAFAGLHNKGKRIILIFDEASAISDKIWEVAEGALTDKETEILWLVFGNYTRNTGRFHECFGRYRHRWEPHQIDSRSVRISNKEQIGQWIKDYGEDSDFVRVRVRGVAPKSGDRQFISSAVVEEARKRVLPEAAYAFAPKILTLDSAWDGDDEIVIGLRQGLGYKQLAAFRKNDDDGKLAAKLADLEDQHDAAAVFIDFGYGTGVYSFGKAMGRKWILVKFGGEAVREGYLNKRAEMWAAMRDWLKNGGSIPDDAQLCAELVAPEQVGRDDGQVQLESKKDLKKRVGFSPGRADALALSFAFPVRAKDASERRPRRSTAQPVSQTYNPFADGTQQQQVRRAL